MPEFNSNRARPTGLVAALLVAAALTVQAAPAVLADAPAARSAATVAPVADPLQQFTLAWRSAAQGRRADFERLMPSLESYLLYPYLQYEDLRYRRARVADQEMAGFLQAHADWAFTPGLERAWLRTLGKRRQWDSLLAHAPGVLDDTEVDCYLAHARIERGLTEGLLPVAQSLWTVGKSQPDACDPVFAWLIRQDGISTGLAWERVRRAMDARQPKLTRYLARFLAPEDRIWADRWYQLDRGAYRSLKRAAKWPDQQHSRDITAYGLRRQARSDPDSAWDNYLSLESRFAWDEDVEGGILREIALWSAVEGVAGTPERMDRVPSEYRDGQLWEWWARFHLQNAQWQQVLSAIESMPADQKDDMRWRFWDARARHEAGDVEQALERFGDLALEANYYGFLAADKLELPYTICPEAPDVPAEQVQALRQIPGFQRALELRRAGVTNWSRSEWKTAVQSLDRDGLRAAAALATRAGWPDMAIFALGNSGDLRWYDWRFPIEYAGVVEERTAPLHLDSGWVMGLMRSESAMAEDALSSAGARGLMQVMPATARQLSRKHALPYRGKQQLMQAQDNIRFGTVYLRDLMDRYGESEVLASGAYNAGPHVVDRWLKERRTDDAAIFIETLPYYETRDYIPRVLAFSTLYDWRLQKPVRRVSARMPALDAGSGKNLNSNAVPAEVVCRTPGQGTVEPRS